MINIPGSPTNGDVITLGGKKYTYLDGRLNPFIVRATGTELASSVLNTEVLTERRHPVTGKPLYTKTINFGTLPNNTTKNVAHGVTDVEDILVDKTLSRAAWGSSAPDIRSIDFPHPNPTYGWYCIARADAVSITTAADRRVLSAIVTIVYTKTTDTASSPVASITTGSQNELVESQETLAGYRRNGKDVYWMEIDCGTLPNNTIKTVAIPNYNAAYKYWISSESYSSKDVAVISLPFPYGSVSNNNVGLYIIKDSGNLNIETWANFTAYTETKVVLHYTK